jgi:hypothetical protein
VTNRDALQTQVRHVKTFAIPVACVTRDAVTNYFPIVATCARAFQTPKGSSPSSQSVTCPRLDRQGACLADEAVTTASCATARDMAGQRSGLVRPSDPWCGLVSATITAEAESSVTVGAVTVPVLRRRTSPAGSKENRAEKRRFLGHGFAGHLSQNRGQDRVTTRVATGRQYVCPELAGETAGHGPGAAFISGLRRPGGWDGRALFSSTAELARPGV